MFKVTYTYFHPSDVTPYPRIPEDLQKLRMEQLVKGVENGILAVDTLTPLETTRTHIVQWKSQEAYEAYVNKYSQENQLLIDVCKNDIERDGGTLTITFETTE